MEFYLKISFVLVKLKSGCRPQVFCILRLNFLSRLHDTFNENVDYAGYIIPPPPPRPDFDASREKLRKLGDAEGTVLFIKSCQTK